MRTRPVIFDKVVVDCMGEVMEEAFGLKIMKNETKEAFTGRSTLVFARLQSEGVNLPSETRNYIVLRGCRLGSLGRATIMSATGRSWQLDDVFMAIWSSFPGCPPDRWSHGTFGVELEDRIEDETQDHAEFGDDACLNPKLRRSWEPWKQTKTAMAEEKLSRD